ncbi:MAG: hypothetical protein AAB518_00140 [Patescibacteria group bacterium]
MKRTIPCKDCGSEGVNHRLEFALNAANWLIDPITKPLDNITNRALRRLGSNGLLDRCAISFINQLHVFGVVSSAREPDEGDALAVHMLWNEAKKRDIKMTEFRFRNGKRNVFIAEYAGECICFEGLPRPRGSASDALAWMDNKGILKKKLARAGFPVARGKAAFSEQGALRTFRRIEKPVITKPHVGSGSRHTTIHLNDEPAFLAAFRTAKQVSPFIVVEEELKGSVFRATVIDGKVVGVIRRDPPQIAGTGRSSIRNLVARANSDPKRKGPIFHPIATGIEADQELNRQELSWDSIPKKGQVVTLNQKINWSSGGTTEDVTENTHLANINLFERIGAFLKDPLIGIDFIIEEIDKPWNEEPKCGVIEINSAPFIDNHHLPFTGKPRNVAGALWDIVFPGSRR